VKNKNDTVNNQASVFVHNP